MPGRMRVQESGYATTCELQFARYFTRFKKYAFLFFYEVVAFRRWGRGQLSGGGGGGEGAVNCLALAEFYNEQTLVLWSLYN